MDRILKGTGLSAAVALVVLNSIGTPASAITVKLAKKCRDMAIKAHPPALPGAKKGSAQAEREFYRNCILNGGIGSDDDTHNSAAPPAK
jgi:hypothetical protein